MTNLGRVDEAHRATGDYAYTRVIRYLTKKDAHFRVLALTATPGSTLKAVQAVVDSLLISHIEIRDEDSPDLKAYTFKRVSSAVFDGMATSLENTSDDHATCYQDE